MFLVRGGENFAKGFKKRGLYLSLVSWLLKLSLFFFFCIVFVIQVINTLHLEGLRCVCTCLYIYYYYLIINNNTNNKINIIFVVVVIVIMQVFFFFFGSILSCKYFVGGWIGTSYNAYDSMNKIRFRPRFDDVMESVSLSLCRIYMKGVLIKEKDPIILVPHFISSHNLVSNYHNQLSHKIHYLQKLT